MQDQGRAALPRRQQPPNLTLTNKYRGIGLQLHAFHMRVCLGKA
jgi:hypothetical protein